MVTGSTERNHKPRDYRRRQTHLTGKLSLWQHQALWRWVQMPDGQGAWVESLSAEGSFLSQHSQSVMPFILQEMRNFFFGETK